MQAQKNDPSALAFESSIISELLGSKLKKDTIFLLNVFLRCYKIQFPGWNLKPLKNSDMQSGIKSSLRHLLEVWVSPLPLPEHATTTMLWLAAACCDAAEMELWKTLLHISASETATGGQNFKTVLLLWTVPRLKSHLLLLFYSRWIHRQQKLFHLSPLDPKLEEWTKSTFEWAFNKQ